MVVMWPALLLLLHLHHAVDAQSVPPRTVAPAAPVSPAAKPANLSSTSSKASVASVTSTTSTASTSTTASTKIPSTSSSTTAKSSSSSTTAASTTASTAGTSAAPTLTRCNGDDVACPAANGTRVCTPIDLMLNKTTCEIRGCPKGQAPIHVGTNQTLTCVPLTILSGGLLPSMWQFAACSTMQGYLNCGGEWPICVGGRKVISYSNGTCTMPECPNQPGYHQCAVNSTKRVCLPHAILSNLQGADLCSIANPANITVLHSPAPNCLPYKDTVACSNSNGTQYACVHYTQLVNVSGGGSVGLQCTGSECKAAGELFCNGTCLNVDDVDAVGPDGQCRLHPKPPPEPANAPEVIVKKPKAAQMHADYTAVNILIMVFLGILALLAVLAVIVYFALKRSAKNKKKKKSTSSEHTYGSDPEPPVKKKKSTKSDKEDNLDPAFLTVIDDKASHAASAIRSTH